MPWLLDLLLKESLSILDVRRMATNCAQDTIHPGPTNWSQPLVLSLQTCQSWWRFKANYWQMHGVLVTYVHCGMLLYWLIILMGLDIESFKTCLLRVLCNDARRCLTISATNFRRYCNIVIIDTSTGINIEQHVVTLCKLWMDMGSFLQCDCWNVNYITYSREEINQFPRIIHVI